MKEVEKKERGHYHPLSIVARDLEKAFREMGFSIALGPEVDTEEYNFNKLNVPPDHPARDMQDTFWVASEEKKVLRTQTSNMQIHYMEKHIKEGKEFPIRIIVPGRVYRAEATDSRHEATFHQMECLVVGEDVTLGHLKWVLDKGFSDFFGTPTETRLRPGYFPFVEPGLEMDARCVICGGYGEREEGAKCGPCKGTGWLELGGAGMVHPKVLSDAGINPNIYSGFAFGFGLERLAMIKYKVDDIRLFLSGDLRLVNQF